MANKSQKNEKTWSQKLAESQGLKKQGSEFLYERVLLYIEISKDKDFIADCRHRNKLPEDELSRELDDSPIPRFSFAIEMLELYPKKEDWKSLGTQKIIAKTEIHRKEQDLLYNPPVPRKPKPPVVLTTSELKEANERLKRVADKATDKAKKDAADKANSDAEVARLTAEKKELEKSQAVKDAASKKAQDAAEERARVDMARIKRDADMKSAKAKADREARERAEAKAKSEARDKAALKAENERLKKATVTVDRVVASDELTRLREEVKKIPKLEAKLETANSELRIARIKIKALERELADVRKSSKPKKRSMAMSR